MTENKLNKPIYLMIYIALMVLALFGCTDNGEYTLHLFYPPDGGFDWILWIPLILSNRSSVNEQLEPF